MNCADANHLVMVQWLAGQGYQPQKIKGTDYWYLSLLRDEKETSFKVHKSKNVCMEVDLVIGKDHK